MPTITQADVHVPQPAPYFGAVKGKNRYGRWLALLPVVLAVFTLTVIVYHMPNMLNDFDANRQTSVAGLALAVSVIGGLAYLVYTHHVFTYAESMFREDVEDARDQYAATVFRDWLNNRYGVTFTKDAAINLVRGRTAIVNRPVENGRTQRVKVFLDGISPLANTVGIDSVGDVPDLSHLHDDLTLMIVEEPVKSRVYAWN